MSKLIGIVFNGKLTCFETVLRGEQLFHVNIQGARGIAARFLKWSPASTVSPIMTKFSQYLYPPLHLLLSTGVHLPARLKGPRQENQRAVIVKIIHAV